jgi:uncharacterized protein YhfF
MEVKPVLKAYWQKFLETQPDPAATAQRFYESFYFGGSEAIANELAELVVKGVKTATSALVWEVEAEGKPFVKPGDLSIVTTWDGQPVCVIETTEVRILPFNAVDAQFAYDYGEEERTLEWWRGALWASYQKICADLGKESSPDMLLVCERFKVVYR